MSHLSKEDLKAIDDLAREISSMDALCDSKKFELAIHGQSLAVQLSILNKDISENTAEITTGCNPVITLKLANVDLSKNRETTKQSIRWLLVHEATHFIRKTSGCSKPADVTEAGDRVNAYCENETEDNYIAYVECAEERPPHAAMLALEMRDSPKIDKCPKKSRLYEHFKEKCKNPPDESKLKKLICKLSKDATSINKALKQNP